MDPPGKSKYVHTSRSASDAKIAISGAEISMQNTHPCHQRPTRSARLHTYQPVFTLCISLLLLHESGVRASTISAGSFRVALIGRITQKGECDGRT